MARPPKSKLDYAGWSVDMFDNDTKIDKLLDAQGWSGFGIYFYLCMRAYGSEGYFYKWSYDDCATTARKMGGGIGSGTVKETVGYCLQIGLFDKGLFDRWGIITSKGIQSRYWEVAKSRDKKEVISEFWLLHDCEGLVLVPLNTSFGTGKPDFPLGNPSFSERNPGFPEQKESKVKEIKEKENKVNERKGDEIITTDSKESVCQTDVRRIVAKWNELASFGVRPISKMAQSAKRYDNLTARIREYGVDDILTAIDRIKESGFLCGKNNRGWTITFDWFVLPSNFPKVLEGNYDNGSHEKRTVFDEWRDA